MKFNIKAKLERQEHGRVIRIRIRVNKSASYEAVPYYESPTLGFSNFQVIYGADALNRVLKSNGWVVVESAIETRKLATVTPCS